jgi:iron complex outermembrane receptor protein
MPSVGGTMNILTQSTAGKREINVQQEYGSGSFLRSSVSYKSGTLKHGWGILASGSYKKGNGWVDGLATEGGFYYLKVQKKTGNHVTTMSAFGAPQRHGQRSFNQPVSYWNSEYASTFGIDTTGAKNWGRRHNQHFGYQTNDKGERELKNERKNFYHKPQITLKDFWQVNKKLSWSNMAYVSIGRGGGSRLQNSGAIIYDSLGQIDWDAIKFSNQNKTFAGTVIGSTADLTYHPTELKSSQILTASMNNHFWVGGISQIDYKLNEEWDFAAGLDYRNYKGTHFVEIVDLVGGDYWVNNANQNDANITKRVGDKVGWEPYHNHRDGLVQWAGGFGQAEYSKGRWTAFANVSFVSNGYRGIDYFEKKELHDGDSTIYVGATDTVTYNGKTYTTESPELKFNDTGWKWLTGGTYKAGANFNITEKSNFFMNVGYLDRTPQYSNVIDNNTNEFFVEILNEKIYAFELGYGYRSKKLTVNTNGYYTVWKNKPFPFGVNVPDPDDPTTFVRANVNGMDALHMGAELDVSYRLLKNVTIEGMASIGDWTWQSSETIDVLGQKFTFDAKGVHVGDAAQSTYAASIRYEPIKRGYIKFKYVYFDRYYSNFDPFSLTGVNGGKESWKIPSYGMLTVHFGYSFKLANTLLHLRGNVFNVLNTLYISDARNNQNGSGYDAVSSGVFVGQGTTFNVSLGLQF